MEAARKLTRMEAKRAAEAEKSHEKQAIAAKALRNLSYTLAAVAGIAAVAAAFGFFKKDEAEKETRRAIQAEQEARDDDAAGWLVIFRLDSARPGANLS